MGTDARSLARADHAYLVAPAGFGKTYLIGEAVANWCTGRQLLLTHTHAGVRSMRNNLKTFGCPRDRYEVQTLAAWALRYARSYPIISGLSLSPSGVPDDWDAVYPAAARVLQSRAVRRVVESSYSGIFVDEYQDCTLPQHSLVLAISELLPCRILGDPLQGIFEFAGQPLDWNNDVCNSFNQLAELSTPHRWSGTNPGLGNWLQHVRRKILDADTLSLEDLPPGVEWRPAGQEPIKTQIAVCKDVGRSYEGRIAAIHEGTQTQPCIKLAQRLGGQYRILEPAECPALMSTVRSIENSTGNPRALAVVEFATSCMTTVGTELRTVKQRLARESGRKERRLKKHAEIYTLLQKVGQSDGFSEILPALDAISSIPGAKVYRSELLSSFRRSIEDVESSRDLSLSAAAWRVRQREGKIGRPLPQRVVSRSSSTVGSPIRRIFA